MNATATTDYLTISEAAKIAPGQPHLSAVWRWCRRGILTRAGGRVYLKHIRAGGRVFTTAQWLNDFYAAIEDGDLEHFSKPKNGGAKLPKARTPNARQRAVERARVELAKEGI